MGLPKQQSGTGAKIARPPGAGPSRPVAGPKAAAAALRLSAKASEVPKLPSVAGRPVQALPKVPATSSAKMAARPAAAAARPTAAPKAAPAAVPPSAKPAQSPTLPSSVAGRPVPTKPKVLATSSAKMAARPAAAAARPTAAPKAVAVAFRPSAKPAQSPTLPSSVAGRPVQALPKVPATSGSQMAAQPAPSPFRPIAATKAVEAVQLLNAKSAEEPGLTSVTEQQVQALPKVPATSGSQMAAQPAPSPFRPTAAPKAVAVAFRPEAKPAQSPTLPSSVAGRPV
ncbi:MAG: hypothetical protein KME26_32375, partial [Oscillatoria princeps RMCB-10]|nr:hypothetical protein [Oscillatoria princeps RMCB-10]